MTVRFFPPILLKRRTLILSLGIIAAIIVAGMLASGKLRLQKLTGGLLSCGNKQPITCKVAKSMNNHDFVSLVFDQRQPFGTPYYGCKADGGLFVLDLSGKVPILQSGNCPPPSPRVGHISFTPAASYDQRSAEEIAFTTQILGFFPASSFPNLDRRVIYPGQIRWTSDPVDTSSQSAYQAGFVTLDGVGSLYLCDVPANATCSGIAKSRKGAPIPMADVSVDVNGPSQIPKGSSQSYTLTAVNAGPAIGLTMSITLTIPSGLTFNTDQNTGCTQNGSTVTCSNFHLAKGAKKAFPVTFIVTGKCGNSLTLSAAVSTAREDPNLGNNQSSKQSTITCP